MGKRTPAIERYWAKIDTSGGPDACWPWTGCRSKVKSGAKSRRGVGYGEFQDCGKKHRATRWGWLHLIGEIPRGLYVLHTCDNPPCMNPDHWFLGTPADNMADMVSKGRSLSGDRSPSRQNPERLRWKENHPFRVNPELIPRGNRSWVHNNAGLMPRGERHGRALITEGDVREIRRLRADGVILKDIASRFSLSIPAVYKITIRKTWKHVV